MYKGRDHHDTNRRGAFMTAGGGKRTMSESHSDNAFYLPHEGSGSDVGHDNGSDPPAYRLPTDTAEILSRTSSELWRCTQDSVATGNLLRDILDQLQGNHEMDAESQFGTREKVTDMIKATKEIEQELALLRTEMTKYREQSNRLALISAQNMICGARLDVRRQVILAVWFLGCLLLAWKRAAQEIEE
ncbi:hypothetical protein SISNIDRAFT_469215 [Sistotremastrum niveocremeum HHB9708]|uniref:Uncharacterized protein n=1 Tax=Sistotremastrum niveocremeum HHB9708 TaxID=1314777 RepID=A0A164QJI5_9AGAM|nr:hypothetical protein SISNIDRAFT_469215 [Sistotremastrum niveocremeum HHB9708]